MSGGSDWVGDFAVDWGPPQPPPAPAALPPARETVEIIVCPRCRDREPRPERRTPVARWVCDKCYYAWKEDPAVGMVQVRVV